MQAERTNEVSEFCLGFTSATKPGQNCKECCKRFVTQHSDAETIEIAIFLPNANYHAIKLTFWNWRLSDIDQ